MWSESGQILKARRSNGRGRKVMVILKIALIGVGGAILAVIVRQFQKEYGVFVLLAVCLFLMAYLTSNVSVVVEFAEELGD